MSQSENYKWLVLIGTGIVTVALGVDYAIVNTALAPIQNELHASVAQLQWLMSGFGLLFVGFLVAMGRLADLKGRRVFFYLGAGGFALASLGAGLAHSIHMLIAMRVLQGLFCAAIFPSGMALIANAFPEDERPKALGIYASFLGVGFAIGPLLGSVIVSLLNWRWIFLFNVPLTVISFIICLPILKESKKLHPPPVDWWGVSLLIISISALVFAVSEGNTYGWLSHLIIAAFIVSVIALLIFIGIERRVCAPLISLTLFANAGFTLGLLIFIIAIALPWGVIFMMPLYLHKSVGLSTHWVGIILFSMTLMTMIGPAVSGSYLGKKGPRGVCYAVCALSIVSLLLFTRLQAYGPIWLVVIAFILFGSAWGAGNGIAVPLGLSKLATTEDSGFIVGAMNTIMNLIGIVMLAITAAILEHYSRNKVLPFVSGLHVVCTMLLAISVVLSIIAMIVLHRFYRP